MDAANRDDLDGADLWERLARAASAPEPAPDINPNLLAAYVDGTATPDEIERVERAMTADRNLVETVRDLRAAEPADPPEAVTARIQTALAAQAAAEGRAPRPAGTQWGLWFRAAAAAAAILLASLAGYELGEGTSRAQGETEAALASQVAMDLTQDDIEADLVAVLGAVESGKGSER